MKFVETLNATFVNVNDICRIGHQYHEGTKRYYSYIYLRDGEELDFLDVIDFFEDEDGERHNFNCDHLISWHRHATQILCEIENGVITLDDLMEKSWLLFIEEFQNKIKKKKNES